ncbi:hypothetical protein EHLJMEHL_02639 [Vreelandella titanicae]
MTNYSLFSFKKLMFAFTICSFTLMVAVDTHANEDFPSKPIKLVAHVGPGGAADVFARTLARAAEPIAGQPIVVENRPGGGGAAQMAVLTSAEPDGYTLGTNTLTHLTAMLTNLSGVFSPDDFSWIFESQTDSHTLIVKDDSQYASLDELVADARSGNISLTVGGYGSAGSTQNIAMQMVADAADITFDWIAYGSSTDAISSMLGEHVIAVMTNPGQAVQFIEAGRARALGVLSEERNALLPEVPTFAEAGYAEANTNWQQIRGIYGPAGIPEDVQMRIAEIFTEAMQTDEFLKYQAQAGLDSSLLGPKDYAKSISEKLELADRALTQAGIK